MKLQSIIMSRPKGKKIHGITIRKLPCGKYLDMLETMGGAIYRMVEAAWPGMSAEQVLAWASKVTREELREVILRLMTVVPKECFALMAELLETSVDTLRDALTPTELMEVLAAFAETNSYQDFFRIARRLVGTTGAKKMTSGMSSNGLRQVYPRGSANES